MCSLPTQSSSSIQPSHSFPFLPDLQAEYPILFVHDGQMEPFVPSDRSRKGALTGCRCQPFLVVSCPHACLAFLAFLQSGSSIALVGGRSINKASSVDIAYLSLPVRCDLLRERGVGRARVRSRERGRVCLGCLGQQPGRAEESVGDDGSVGSRTDICFRSLARLLSICFVLSKQRARTH